MNDAAPETDDSALLARLRAADPAASLPPAGPDRVTHLLEAAMTDTTTHETRESGTHDRSPLTWLVAAAAVLLIAAAGVFGLVNRDHGPAPAAQGTVTMLGYAPTQGRCVLPSVGVLRVQTIAFRGTLTTLTDGSATFRVGHWFKGGPTDLAKVTTAPALLRPLAESADLQVGETYLVAARDGQVTGCGFTGPATGRLATLYQQAYAG
ncbi:hypothetical protein [Nocardioides cynanchi]|uniref:hypothetical protein n=1 Tax=Nocardioides cynanchi TaxID=2558918 RepID=UPI001247FE9F|nr:hypothetical protein [Nocardioides cynanchi]